MIKASPEQPIAQNTHLGWIVSGIVSSQKSLYVKVNHTSICDELRKFWEHEEVNFKPVWTEENQLCNEHYGRF